MARTFSEIMALTMPEWVNSSPATRYAWSTMPGWRQQAHDCKGIDGWVKKLTKEAKNVWTKEGKPLA